jgi:hypothetical protein
MRCEGECDAGIPAKPSTDTWIMQSDVLASFRIVASRMPEPERHRHRELTSLFVVMSAVFRGDETSLLENSITHVPHQRKKGKNRQENNCCTCSQHYFVHRQLPNKRPPQETCFYPELPWIGIRNYINLHTIVLWEGRHSAVSTNSKHLFATLESTAARRQVGEGQSSLTCFSHALCRWDSLSSPRQTASMTPSQAGHHVTLRHTLSWVSKTVYSSFSYCPP